MGHELALVVTMESRIAAAARAWTAGPGTFALFVGVAGAPPAPRATTQLMEPDGSDLRGESSVVLSKLNRPSSSRR